MWRRQPRVQRNVHWHVRLRDKLARCQLRRKEKLRVKTSSEECRLERRRPLQRKLRGKVHSRVQGWLGWRSQAGRLQVRRRRLYRIARVYK